MIEPIQHRYDFSLFFDCENGNPNGDPDAGNLPRIDPDTGLGIVSDVCLKRKVRNYVDLVMNEPIDTPDVEDGEHGFKIYVQSGEPLNEVNRRAYVHNEIDPTEDAKLPKEKAEAKKVVRFMCDNFYDVRTFGAVMSTKVSCGQVCGPVQIGFAKSIDPVLPLDMSIIRSAVTDAESGKDHTMGRKAYIPYGLYRADGYISASLAEKSGFDQADLDLFWKALMNMFEDDRSAARGLMTSRELVIFEHESKYGNATAAGLFDTVTVKRTIPNGQAARHWTDYAVEIDETKLPKGVTAKILI